MSEYHDTGLTKQENYRIARHQVDSDFDKRLSKKSFFESKREIEAEREEALKKVHNQFWSSGRGHGGCFSEV